MERFIRSGRVSRGAFQIFAATATSVLLAACGSSGESGIASDNATGQTPDRTAGSDGSRTGGAQSQRPGYFKRIASFPVCRQLQPDCDVDDETVAEIVAASRDGMTLIYTDGTGERVGLVDLRDPLNPQAGGLVDVGGEPTSVTVVDRYALVAVNTSADYVKVSGSIKVIDLENRAIVESIDVGGQPDSIAVSRDGRYGAVVIENERDEDLGNGEPPQLPAGRLLILDLVGDPARWGIRPVEMTGLAALFAGDPEPEFVDINSANLAVVTLQENNHIVLVDLASGAVTGHFPAGTVDLSAIDATEEEPPRISLTESLSDVPREPDAVAWLSDSAFATADEGDLNGGSRGFTVFDKSGAVLYGAGNSLEHLAVRLGHYPESRSANKGGEPEGAEVGQYEDDKLLFIASERANLVSVYNVDEPAAPIFRQALPTGAGPEGVLAIAARNLLVVASEVDSRDDKIRSSINIYQYDTDLSTPAYPSIQSADAGGVPIAWGAMSGLTASAAQLDRLYAVSDSYYQRNRVFSIDIGQSPALITDAFELTDPDGVLTGLPAVAVPGAEAEPDAAARAAVFDTQDLAALVNDDKTVNLDPEGIGADVQDGFWIVSEGAGTIGDSDRPINSLNLLLKTSSNGVIQQAFTLPEEVNAMQSRFGFEGVADDGHRVVVAFQRAWGNEEHPRIGIFDKATCTWRFVYYPLDTPESAAGGWVGLSDITALGNDSFLVIERDNQGGPDAAIKRLYRFSLAGVADNGLVAKTLVDDLSDDLSAPGGLIAEKIEGLARLASGDVFVINDNDGVEDNSGETQLLRLRGLSVE